jgi:hypothetical protein
MASSDGKRTKVFVSYSHRDSDWLKRLHVHLRPLVRDSTIELWDDTHILAGADWRAEIAAAVNSAKVAILLISADFLASDFITTDELPVLLDAAEREGAIIIPIILSPSRFLKTERLAKFQPINSTSKPIISMSKAKQEEVFLQVADRVEITVGRQELRAELSDVRQQLADLNSQVAQLFLLTMSEAMYFNLKKLTRETGFGPYKMQSSLRRELYHLRDIGYIQVAAISNIDREGTNLSDHVSVTEAGRQFVELREAMVQQLGATVERK